MSDCRNAEVRDRLPELLHERLEESARAVLVAHVEQCADCRAELVLLREARVVLLSGEPTVDIGAIARSVVARTRTSAVTPVRRLPVGRRPWMDWRIAASIVLLVIAGGSVMTMRNWGRLGAVGPVAMTPAPRSSAPNVDTSAPIIVTTAEPTARALRTDSEATAELSAAGGVGDLSESDLRALLQDLDGIDAVPATEPEPVTVRVSLPGTGERGSE